jgi:Pilus formation protein N terminal region
MTFNCIQSTRFSKATAISALMALSAISAALGGVTEAIAQSTPPAAVERKTDLIVNFDQSTLLQLSRAADLVIVGNPAIADVAIQSGNLLVVTGKSFGITNIIVLDAEKKVIQDQRLLVRRDDEKVVSVTRGKDRQTFNCAGGQCNPSMTVGDDPVFFNAVKEMTVGKSSTSDKSGDPGSTNN